MAQLQALGVDSYSKLRALHGSDGIALPPKERLFLREAIQKEKDLYPAKYIILVYIFIYFHDVIYLIQYSYVQYLAVSLIGHKMLR